MIMMMMIMMKPRISFRRATTGLLPTTAAAFHTNVSNVNQQIVQAEYAVRGAIVVKADKYAARLAAGDRTLPFEKVIPCNIGNPQSLEQRPLSFHRSVLSLVTYPQMLEHAEQLPPLLFPDDAVERARTYLKRIPSGTGAYSNSQGVDVVREEVAEFISDRDGGHPANPRHIFLTDGASPAVKMMLNLLIRSSDDGILIPIPQYPLYSASITMFGGAQVPYYLDESKGWGLTVSELERALAAGREAGKTVRGLVVINPGNPTGQCLSAENMRDIALFCEREGLTLMADEVYQENIYHTTPFTSFKKVVCDLALKELELVSFHSVSKGFIGECGRRGGYMELHNFDEAIVEQLYKLASVSLCSNLDGQLMVGLMVRPPTANDPSYATYAQERDQTCQSLRRRAIRIAEVLNSMEGVSCNTVEGALYAFPTITLPKKAIDEARTRGIAPDAMYCTELLDHTGLVVVPGSGFGQRDGTFHFRTTILPPEAEFDAIATKLTTFHKTFMHKYN